MSNSTADIGYRPFLNTRKTRFRSMSKPVLQEENSRVRQILILSKNPRILVTTCCRNPNLPISPCIFALLIPLPAIPSMNQTVKKQYPNEKKLF